MRPSALLVRRYSAGWEAAAVRAQGAPLLEPLLLLSRDRPWRRPVSSNSRWASQAPTRFESARWRSRAVRMLPCRHVSPRTLSCAA